MKVFDKISFIALLVITNWCHAQENEGFTGAVPSGAEFLLYNTDVRSAAMGNLKSIGLTDAFSLFSNPAKLSYQEDVLQNDISLSYSPVLPKYAKDMNIFSVASNNLFVSGRGRENYIGFGFQYFTLGGVELTDKQGNITQFLRPKEMSFNIAYSTEVIEYLHMGVTFKGIYSKLISSDATTNPYKSAFAGALDYGVYFNYPLSDDGQLNLGYVLKNLGTKLKYENDASSTGLPTTMNLGAGYTKRIIDDNSYFFIGAEVNKPFISDNRENTSLLPLSNPSKLGYSIGAELMVKSVLSAMVGYDAKSIEYGNIGYITGGVTVNTYFNSKKLALSAAFLTPNKREFSSGNIYRLGLSFSILE